MVDVPESISGWVFWKEMSAIRFILAGVVAVIGYLAVMQSFAVALPDSQIERAHALTPSNGRIAARLSAILSGPDGDSADWARATRVAQSALRNDPTAVEAVATLALDAAIRGEEGRARDLFIYSQVLSRRDLRTQLWAIEDAVGRGNVAEALDHYDIALRTKPRAPGLLYPVLVAASSDANVRSELVRKLTASPRWADSFLNYAARNNEDPANIVRLFRQLGGANFQVPMAASDILINSLLAEGSAEEAWSYYSLVRKGAQRHISRDPVFEIMPATPLAFDWKVRGGRGISAAIQPGENGSVFDFAVVPSLGGILLEQVQVLPEGDYVLEGKSSNIELSTASRPYWILTCRGGGEAGRLDVPNSSPGDGRFFGHFRVPHDCPLQILALVARSSHAIAGVRGQIKEAQLRPAR